MKGLTHLTLYGETIESLTDFSLCLMFQISLTLILLKKSNILLNFALCSILVDLLPSPVVEKSHIFFK